MYLFFYLRTNFEITKLIVLDKFGRYMLLLC